MGMQNHKVENFMNLEGILALDLTFDMQMWSIKLLIRKMDEHVTYVGHTKCYAARTGLVSHNPFNHRVRPAYRRVRSTYSTESTQ